MSFRGNLSSHDEVAPIRLRHHADALPRLKNAHRPSTFFEVELGVRHGFAPKGGGALPVSLERARGAQVGIHEQLMSNHGPYSELYTIQANAYR